jgi:hypothetical protein
LRSIINKLSLVGIAALGLAACSSAGAGLSSQKPSAAMAEDPTEAEEAAPATNRATIVKNEDGSSWDGKFYRGPDGDDYRASDTMTAWSSQPGWKNERELEIEKIHRLAKSCISVNNTSAPCLEIIKLDARMGKFYILQRTGEVDGDLKRMSRQAQ